MHAPTDFIHKILTMVLSVPGTFLGTGDATLNNNNKSYSHPNPISRNMSSLNLYCVKPLNLGKKEIKKNDSKYTIGKDKDCRENRIEEVMELSEEGELLSYIILSSNSLNRSDQVSAVSG